jgi:hypothetical protein
MHNSVAAIHAVRSRTRFVTSPPRGADRRLGLHPAAISRPAAGHVRDTVAALRHSGATPHSRRLGPRRHGPATLRERPSITWTRPTTSFGKGASSAIAAPWRA